MNMLFDGWIGLLRTTIVGVSAYIALVFLLRISGKRTLSKLNAFDLIVTVALGSTLATVLLNKNVALAEGVVAFALLIGLQFAVTWTSVRVPWVRRGVTGEPQMLFYRGQFLDAALHKERVLRDEVRAGVRSSGLHDLTDVEAVVLETDGSFSIVHRNGEPQNTSLADVRSAAVERSTLANERAAQAGSRAVRKPG